jgi:polysaccharide export outer membrane protein
MFDRPRELDPIAALALAGGPTADADLSSARLVLSEESRSLDLIAGVNTGTQTIPLPKKGGAVLFIPGKRSGVHDPLAAHINVLGAVKQGGRVHIRGPLTLVDALALAGGAEERGDLSEVAVVRSSGASTLVLNYDVEDALQHGGGALRVGVRPGDSVVVGARLDLPPIISQTLRAVTDAIIIAGAVSLLAR